MFVSARHTADVARRQAMRGEIGSPCVAAGIPVSDRAAEDTERLGDARQHPRRNGLTLLEMLLVLTLIVVAFSIALPRLMGTASSRRLVLAAQQTRTAMTRARNRAMRSGQVHEFLFRESGRSFASVPVGNSMDPEATAAYDAVVQQLSMEDDETFEGDETQMAGQVRLVERLPEGVRFLDTQSEAPATASNSAAASAAAGGGTTGLVRVMFYADGTTSTATVWLTNDDEEVIGVLLRGATGVVKVGELTRNSNAVSTRGSPP